MFGLLCVNPVCYLTEGYMCASADLSKPWVTLLLLNWIVLYELLQNPPPLSSCFLLFFFFLVMSGFCCRSRMLRVKRSVTWVGCRGFCLTGILLWSVMYCWSSRFFAYNRTEINIRAQRVRLLTYKHQKEEDILVTLPLEGSLTWNSLAMYCVQVCVRV